MFIARDTCLFPAEVYHHSSFAFYFMEASNMDIRVAFIGNVDSGKSSLIGWSFPNPNLNLALTLILTSASVSCLLFHRN
jgi:hypothetical protein